MVDFIDMTDECKFSPIVLLCARGARLESPGRQLGFVCGYSFADKFRTNGLIRSWSFEFNPFCMF